METLFWLAVFAAIAWWFYKSGKRIGSRKGYNVGRSRGIRFIHMDLERVELDSDFAWAAGRFTVFGVYLALEIRL